MIYMFYYDVHAGKEMCLTGGMRCTCSCMCTGVLVDKSDRQSLTAFRFQMMQNNAKQVAKFKITDEQTHYLTMDNSFTVGTASTCVLLFAISDIPLISV